VSTEDQEREGTSLDSQKEACLKKAQELGYEVPEEFSISETYAGLSPSRGWWSGYNRKNNFPFSIPIKVRG